MLRIKSKVEYHSTLPSAPPSTDSHRALPLDHACAMSVNVTDPALQSAPDKNGELSIQGHGTHLDTAAAVNGKL
jgi:hypothetical protein